MKRAEINSREFSFLMEAVLSLNTVEEARKFFRDLCTLAELKAMTERWEVAKRVTKGESYREISKKTGASTTTVTRVAHWLRNGEGGYRLVLERIREKTR